MTYVAQMWSFVLRAVLQHTFWCFVMDRHKKDPWASGREVQDIHVPAI